MQTKKKIADLTFMVVRSLFSQNEQIHPLRNLSDEQKMKCGGLFIHTLLQLFLFVKNNCFTCMSGWIQVNLII